jgi:hypothetical protein
MQVAVEIDYQVKRQKDTENFAAERTDAEPRPYSTTTCTGTGTDTIPVPVGTGERVTIASGGKKSRRGGASTSTSSRSIAAGAATATATSTTTPAAASRAARSSSVSRQFGAPVRAETKKETHQTQEPGSFVGVAYKSFPAEETIWGSIPWRYPSFKTSKA